MGEKKRIEERVHFCYWEENLNCTTTVLKVLGEIHDIAISQQVLDSALGMHGAGCYGAQCGLVEGSLLFIGIFGRARRFRDEQTVSACNSFAKAFEARFSSLVCRELRPEGFSPELPPHLCEGLSCAALAFTDDFIRLTV